MVECCWTAASSSLSKMVHSPMVMDKWPSSQKKRDFRGRPLVLQRTPSSSSSSSSQDGPGVGGGGLHPTLVPHQLSFLTSTIDLASLCLWLCVSLCVRVIVSSPGPVPLCFPSWWRRGAGLIASPLLSPSISSPLLSPPPSPVRWCLSSPCRTTLFCATAYAIAHCMTAMISLSFPLASLRPRPVAPSPLLPPPVPAFVLHPTPRALLVLYLHCLPSVLLCARPCIVSDLCLCCTLATLT